MDEGRARDLPTRWVVALLSGAVALSALLGSIRLGRKSLWYDEGFSAMHASDGLGGAIDVARHVDSNMPLYAIVLTPWRALGDGEAAMRSLSVVCMALTVVAVFLLATRLFGRITGLVGAFLVAVAPFAVQYSHELRGYTMLLLLTTLGSWCFASALTTRRTWWFVLYGLVAAAACYAHLVALTVVGAQVVSLVFLGWRRLPWRQLLLSAVVGGVVLVPLAAIVLSAADNQGVTDTVTLASVPRVLSHVAGGWALLVILGMLCLAPVDLAVRAWRTEGPSPAVWRPAFVLCGIVVPYLGVLGGALVMGRNWSDRYVIVILPSVAIGAALGLQWIAERRRALAVGVAGLVVVLAAVEIVDWYGAEPVDDWRAAAATVLSRSTADDGIVFCSSPIRIPFEYYALRSPAHRRPQPLSPAAPWGNGVHFFEVSPERTEEWSEAPARIWVVSRYASARPFGACDLDSSMDGRDRTFSRTVGGIEITRYDR